MTQAKRHLLAIEGMTRGEIEALLESAEQHRQEQGRSDARKPLLGKVVANVFFEDSTRTRSSFEVAAKALGAEVLNWTTRGTSVSKGETLIDTLKNLDALGPAALVLRHPSSGAAHLAAQHTRASVVNAGDGQHEHPSQALLDAFTLKAHWGALDRKRVLVVGDILHSRVARSNFHCLKALGAEVLVCGPATLMPKDVSALGVEVAGELDEALPRVDAVMMLRIQLERQTESYIPSAREYARRWGLSPARAARLKKRALILHPGPINRGVEIHPEVADGPQSVILEQVAHGVAVRRAILEACA